MQGNCPSCRGDGEGIKEEGGDGQGIKEEGGRQEEDQGGGGRGTA